MRWRQSTSSSGVSLGSEIVVDRVRMRARSHVAAIVCTALVEHDEPVRVPDGQKAEHELIHQGENGGVGANAEGERQDGDTGEKWTSADGTQGESHVRQETRHTSYTTEAGAGY